MSSCSTTPGRSSWPIRSRHGLGGARVDADGRTWWGSCAWDGLGIVAALGLGDAAVSAQEVTVRVRDGAPAEGAIFHVAVPAAHWWDDIAHT